MFSAFPVKKTSMSSSRMRTSSIQLVLTRHEQPAAFMAATHGRLTGQPGRLPLHIGAWGAEPHHGRGLCVARRDADAHDHGAETHPQSVAKQARFQIVDIVNTMRPLTKLEPADRERPHDRSRRWCAKPSAVAHRANARDPCFSNCRRILPRNDGTSIDPDPSASTRSRTAVARRGLAGARRTMIIAEAERPLDHDRSAATSANAWR